MPIPKKKIEQSLRSKGFVEEDVRHHRYFYHKYNGKFTGVSTYTSHGSRPKDYGDNLLAMMKKQLRLKKLAEVRDLFNCPMTGEEYNLKLKEYGIIDA